MSLPFPRQEVRRNIQTCAYRDAFGIRFRIPSRPPFRQLFLVTDSKKFRGWGMGGGGGRGDRKQNRAARRNRKHLENSGSNRAVFKFRAFPARIPPPFPPAPAPPPLHGRAFRRLRAHDDSPARWRGGWQRSISYLISLNSKRLRDKFRAISITVAACVRARAHSQLSQR